MKSKSKSNVYPSIFSKMIDSYMCSVVVKKDFKESIKNLTSTEGVKKANYKLA
ncbi:hypothetical protein [Seonamhaeicola maritimus]|uniref:hypothetical protein n=1 Tax=Seonamhaeicola maritimus TaxID=2591822 RepID=UPI0014783D79|nr:hypothetical protein [Seonamhaeicola maritimus]